MTVPPTPVLPASAIAEEYRAAAKSYGAKTQIQGVQVHRVPRFVDDRGSSGIYRAKADHPGARRWPRSSGTSRSPRSTSRS